MVIEEYHTPMNMKELDTEIKRSLFRTVEIENSIVKMASK